MNPIVSIIMGSTSDLPVMEKAAKFLDEMEIPFEMNALSAHRTPVEVETFAREAKGRGVRVMLDGLDAMLSIIQMPPGIPVATVGVNGALNAAILAAEMLALSDEVLAAKLCAYKEGLKEKIVKANQELSEVKYRFKVD